MRLSFEIVEWIFDICVRQKDESTAWFYLVSIDILLSLGVVVLRCDETQSVDGWTSYF